MAKWRKASSVTCSLWGRWRLRMGIPIRRRTASMHASSRRPTPVARSAPDIGLPSPGIRRSSPPWAIDRTSRDAPEGSTPLCRVRSGLRPPFVISPQEVDVPHEDDAQEIIRVLRTWLERDVAPVVLELEHADEYPRALVEQMREFGLFGATIPTEYGGLGLRASEYARVVEEISKVWMSLTGVINSHLMMAELVRRYGTDDQRARLLPAFAAGDLRGGLALTEPDCGSDLQAVRTQARRDGDRYLVTGNKSWITNGGEGNCLAVLLKTDPEARPRYAGMSLFIALKSDGYQVVRRLSKLGYKGVDTVELVFDEVP